MVNPPTTFSIQVAGLCGTLRAVSLDTLPPELIAEIPAHLPILHCPTVLLSLALTCRCLCDIIIPSLLYQAVWLEGEELAVHVLSSFNARLGQVSEHQISHNIRYLAINSEHSQRQLCEGPTTSLQELRTLIKAGGIPNLVSITLHIGDGRFWTSWQVEPIGGPYGELDPSFWDAAQHNCPSLAHVHLTRLVEQEIDKLLVTNSGLCDFKALKSLRIHGIVSWASGETSLSKVELPEPLLMTSAIEALELPIPTADNPFTSGCWMALHYPNLRTFIANNGEATDDMLVSRFWVRHNGLERVELSDRSETSEWFPQISHGCFPKLRTLKCTFSSAKSLLPHVFSQLVNLTLVDTINAQALYLLRVVTPGGILPRLRSLGIHLISSTHSRRVKAEGNRYHEDDEGHVSETSKRKALRYFNANYLFILAKAVPGVEELELLGGSPMSIDIITSSLQHFYRLHSLILSGPGIGSAVDQFFGSWERHDPFGMGSQYTPQLLEEAMIDIGNGCRTLEHIRISRTPGAPFELHEQAAKIVREEPGGQVIDLKVGKGWGRLIGREEEW